MKKRVAFCVPTMMMGGVETVLVNTVEKFLEYNVFDVSIVLHTSVMEPKYKDWLKKHSDIPVYVYYPLGNWFEKQKSKIKFGPLKLLCRLIYGVYKKYRRFIMWVSGKLKNVDVFVDYKMFDFSKELKWFNAKKIVWIHMNVKYLLERNRAKCIKHYSKVVGLTDAFVKEFKSTFADCADRVIRIYNPIDVKKIQVLSEQDVQKNLGNYFVSVSRLDGYQKDVKTLIDAFELFFVKNNHPMVNLVIVGGGAQEKYLKDYASGLKSAENIFFVGSQNNPFGYMKGAMCNILSSFYEGLPTVLIEAQALGVLNVAADCEFGPDEILLNNKAGVLFKIGDAEQLAEIMTKVYNNNIAKDDMIKSATDALDRFEPDIIIKQICGVLNG